MAEFIHAQASAAGAAEHESEIAELTEAITSKLTLETDEIEAEATGPPAILRTFAITELAESIMDKMGPRELLICQRVCQKFSDIFQRSVEFEQRLHLLPKPGDQGHALPPVLPQIFAEASIQVRDTGTRIDFREELRYGSSFGASWRDMQLASPPVKQVSIYLLRGEQEKVLPFIGYEELVDEDGVTMGSIFLALLRHQTWKREDHLAISF